MLYDVVTDGELTPTLAACKPGDTVLVSEPFGSFVLDESVAAGNSSPVTWIATGTGVAPFLSMARTLGADQTETRHIRLLHGARRVVGLYFADELYRVLGAGYTPCMSVPPTTDADREALVYWNAYDGRISELLRVQGCDPTGVYYLCGSAAMVVDLRDLLVSLGVPFDNIYSEIYF